MSKQKLCWRYREWFGTYYYVAPSNHCHHDEPEEKPKEKCWCDEPTFQMITILPDKFIEVQFCPICGKPRKDWGK
jgi:hypothetical protein